MNDDLWQGKIRIGGAQFPVTPFVNLNTRTIKAAIDWAAENKVDYLLTPEASLSGYSSFFKQVPSVLIEKLSEVEKYAAEKRVGLCLGTLWLENGPPDKEHIKIPRNQIRFYSKEGNFVGATNKTVCTPLDDQLGIKRQDIITGNLLPFENGVIPAGGLICADLFGFAHHNGGLPEHLFYAGAKIYFHATNAERGVDPLRDEIEKIWVESHIRRASHQILPMIVADNCYMMDGTAYEGETLTQSGVCVKGEWVAKVPRTGTQYFYHDFDSRDILVKNPYL